MVAEPDQLAEIVERATDCDAEQDGRHFRREEWRVWKVWRGRWFSQPIYSTPLPPDSRATLGETIGPDCANRVKQMPVLLTGLAGPCQLHLVDERPPLRMTSL